MWFYEDGPRGGPKGWRCCAEDIEKLLEASMELKCRTAHCACQNGAKNNFYEYDLVRMEQVRKDASGKIVCVKRIKRGVPIVFGQDQVAQLQDQVAQLRDQVAQLQDQVAQLQLQDQVALQQ